ncbi:hypothetical protein MNBD_GAMMA24-915 [hydrothermal vent metagenome]|uniref:Major facilitator superfamily (MFS) profile domain-containing protein n=1 Tax=hydrothermal vent metagenome TaxID=652676 RepID=A0A3B1B460_9ZZZZ
MKRLLFALLIMTLGANLPAPLFPLYQAHFGLNSLEITALYAIYAVALIPSLLLIGPLSDQVGRRPVIVPMMLLGVVVTGLFVWAPNSTILFIARAIEGIVLGGVIGTITAFIVDYSLPGQIPRVTMLASITTMIGFGLGPGMGGVVVEYIPWHVLQLPYLLHGILTIIALIAVLTVRETISHSDRIVWRIHIGVPAEVRRPFFSFIVPACFLLFALNGTVIALIPGYVGTVLHSENLAIGGLIIFVLLGVGGLAQLFVQRRAPVPVTQVGLVLTIVGAWIMLEAGRSASIVYLFTGILIQGIGSGLTFKGSLGLAGMLSKPATRAHMFSSYYVAAYLGAIVPVVMVGWLTLIFGLQSALFILTSFITAGSLLIILVPLWGPVF